MTRYVLLWMITASAAWARPERVLVINSYTPTFPTTRPLLDAIEAELPGVHIDVEYLASKSTWNDAYAQDMLRGLGVRLARRRPYDLVIATDDHALDLVHLDGGTVLPLPVVAVGINDASKFDIPRGHGLTGAIETIDLEGTLALARELQPSLERVTLVVDGSASGSAHLEVAHDQLDGAGVEVVAVSLSDGEDQAMRALAHKPEHTHAVVVLSAHISGGLEESFVDVHRRICLDGDRWCYTPFRFGLGPGVIGGSVIDLADHGHIAGSYARRLLDGTPLHTLPVETTSPHRFINRAAVEAHPSIGLPEGYRWFPERRYPTWLPLLGILGGGALVGIGVGAWFWRGGPGRPRDLTPEERHLADVGRIAVGVAHDLNNLLTVVQGYSHIIELEEALPPEVRAELSHIGEASERAGRLTHRVLAWANQRAESPEPLVVGEHIADLAVVLRRVLGRTVKLHLIADTEAVSVLVDPTALDQMVLNLVSNARDAGANAVQLEVHSVELHEPRDVLSGTLPSGSWAVIRATDDGRGLDEDTRQKVVRRGFSTKGGPGTGVGLDTVVQRLAEVGGGYELLPRESTGAVAELWIPRLLGERAEKVQAPFRRVYRELEGDERILVIDDDADVRRVLRRTLENFGYDVQTFRSGRDALERLAGADRPDLAIVDIGLGAMRGTDLVTTLQRQMGGFEVIIVSGSGEVVDPDVHAVVEKPFDTLTLLKLAREQLDRSG